MNDIKVYKFGARWHWRCDLRGEGQCEGGPKRTQEEAYAAAHEHYEQEHRAVDTAGEDRYTMWISAGHPYMTCAQVGCTVSHDEAGR